MMLGLGDGTTTTTTTTTATPATYLNGLEAWSNPGTALSSIGTIFQNAGTAFTSANMPVIAGLLTPPVALVVLLIGAGSKGGRR